MSDFLDCSIINKWTILVACKSFCALTRTDNIHCNKIVSLEKAFDISVNNYRAWLKIFQNFLSLDFKDECLVVNDCNYYFTKENATLKLRHEKSNICLYFTINHIYCFLREFPNIYVHSLCLPDTSKLCFIELLNLFSTLPNDPETTQVIKNFEKKDYIIQFQKTIDLFELNVTAVHIYCCLHKFKKDFFVLYKLISIEKSNK